MKKRFEKMSMFAALMGLFASGGNIDGREILVLKGPISANRAWLGKRGRRRRKPKMKQVGNFRVVVA